MNFEFETETEVEIGGVIDSDVVEGEIVEDDRASGDQVSGDQVSGDQASGYQVNWVAIKDLESELGVSRSTLKKALTALGIAPVTKPETGRILLVTEFEADLVRNKIAGVALKVGEAPTVPDFSGDRAGAEIGYDLATESLGQAERVAEETQTSLEQIAIAAGEVRAKKILSAYAQSAVGTLLEGKAEIDTALAKYLGKH